MRLPDASSVSLHPSSGAFHRWIRSDMRVLRWVLLALYVLIVGGLFLQLWLDAGNEIALPLLAGALLGAQGLMILGTGTVQLCRPIRRRRLLLPVICASFMFTVLAAGFFAAICELFYLDQNDWPWALIFLVTMGASWISWGVLMWNHTRGLGRYKMLSRLTSYLLAGSLAELLATVPAHMIVSRRPGCMVGLGTMLGILAGLSVMLASFGPAIFLLFLRPRHRAEIGADGHPRCPACGYDLFATRHRCPECGLMIAIN
jgi:hypothetical protein